ncbi:DNA polymerase [Streptomyces sp. NPDC048212]|uniref:DNA polymerase n=1 Tax=Streptomyces sp. NPDC048212 TaxID=3156658 RepID=UPI0033F1F9E4
MKVIRTNVRGPITINVVETERDLLGFRQFVIDNPHMGFDTETTGGFNWWDAPDNYGCRLAQFGNHDTAWVLPVEKGGPFVKAMKWALATAKRLAIQNRPFDLHVIESCFGVDPEPLVKKTWDTKLLAHLVDGRAIKEGGIGLKLENLVPHYIDPDTGAAVKKSMNTIAQDLNAQKEVVGFKARNKEKETLEFRFSDHPGLTKESLKAQGYSYIREWKEGIYGKVTKDTVWGKVPLDHEGYNLYAGMDPIFAFRLVHILLALIPRKSLHYGLVGWEHRLQWITYQMERTGYLLDQEYTKARIEELKVEEEKWKAVAAKWGVDLIGSADQIIAAMEAVGYKFTKDSKRTKPSKEHPQGQLSVDDSVLKSFDHPLTEAIVKAKSAQKKRKTWFENALNNVDRNGRVHVSINSCEARSARMTVTGAIAAQTLPAGTGYVRNAFLADAPDLDEQGNVVEEYVTATVDYSSMELMFLAAESGDKRMLKAYNEGEDLHNITAAGAFGMMGWDPNDKDSKHPKRKAGKGTNYTVCFGGGWNAVSTQWDIEEADARKAVNGFWETFPATKVLSNKYTDEARRNGFIYTATGRRILTDERRPYAGMNYRIQGTCRDITARGAIELDKRGFTKWLRLIVHDEFVFSFPKSRAEELTKQAAEIIQFVYKGLLIPADGEIGEQSWGSVIDKEGSKH